VHYRPVADGAEVGGDFYDVVARPGGGWIVAVGDICGSGAAAAVLSGVMRTTVRALARHEERPERLLAGVNDALLAEDSPDALATMACATLGRDGDAFVARLAVGGHPPPLVLRASGEVEVLPVGGPLLGMESLPPGAPADVRLEGGDTLLLYTDGIIDGRPPGGVPFGEARLHAALATAAGRDAAGVLATVDAAMRAYAPGAPGDDTAMLAVRPVGS
jgi:serine phosphatase RsbU (regulator of sigma subunit)